MYKWLQIWSLRGFLSLCLLFRVLSNIYGQNPTPVDSLLHALTNATQDTARANILVSLSNAYKQSDVTKEFYYANEALGLSEKANWDKGKMSAQQLLGDCYVAVTAYKDAVVHYQLSVTSAKKINNTDVEGTCDRSIAQAYYLMNNMNEMVAYQKASLELAQKAGEPRNECRQMDRYALRLSDALRYEEAYSYWQITLAFARSHFKGLEQNEMVANVLNTLATSYVKTHKVDSALYCLRTAEALILPTGNFHTHAYIISSFCDVFESIHKDDSAEIYGEQTVRMGQVEKNIDLQQHYCNTLSHVYEEDHKPALALLYHKKYDSLQNIISNTRQSVSQAMQFAKINIDQQAERNAMEKRSFETIRKNQEAALVAALLAIMTFIALTIFTYRSLRQKQKANKIISHQAASLLEQNKIIDTALKEKEVLLKETHHRVKNNLQLISSLLELQAANLDNESAKNALRSAQRRVLSIATVHNKLYGSDDDETVEFSGFVTDLFTRLKSAFGNDNRIISFENTVPATFIKLNTVVLLGLILNELITNSFKYAFADVTVAKITIDLQATDAMYILRYYDNGPGLPEGMFNQDSGSLGVYLVRRLSKQLKGSASYKYEAGSIFTIIFPNAAS